MKKSSLSVVQAKEESGGVAKALTAGSREPKRGRLGIVGAGKRREKNRSAKTH